MSACVDCGCDVRGGESVANDFPICAKCGEWYADEHEAEARRAQVRCDKLCVVCLDVECDGEFICDGCAFDEGVKASELGKASALIREAVEGYREHGERLAWVWHGPGRARADLEEAAKYGPEDAGISDVFEPRRWLWGWMFSAVIREVDKLARYGSRA